MRSDPDFPLAATLSLSESFCGALPRRRLSLPFVTGENSMMYMETSALDTFGVVSAFESVLSVIYRMESGKDAEPSSSSSGQPMRMIDRLFFDI